MVADKATLDRVFMNDIGIFQEEIADSREVDFFKASHSFVQERSCISLHLRNTMPYPVNIDLTNPTDDIQRFFDITKLPLSQGAGVSPRQPLKFKEDTSAEMLSRLKPDFKLFDSQPSEGSCSTDTCLDPREMAVLRVCQKSQTQPQR